MSSYRELLRRRDAPPGSAWGLFGPDDQLGTINHLTPERVLAASRLVRRGAVFNLDLPLDAFDPPLAPSRWPPRHVIFANSPSHRDEYLDGFYPQASSQIDGLRHMAHPEHGFYRGVEAERLVPGEPTLGVNHWAEHGIVGRGVLVDVARHLAAQGASLDMESNEPVAVSVLDAALAEQGTRLERGDVLMIRFGWLEFYLGSSPERREALSRQIRTPGLRQSHETVEWIWDQGLALVTADNLALEAYPPAPWSHFPDESGQAAAPPRDGLMHDVLIPLLGLAIGELWSLDALAADCAADGIYESMVVANPLNLTGGVGSPANAIAIK